jgi:RNase H-like domain found in reverse transcriptase
LAKPLTDLTSAKYRHSLPWLPEHEQSFCALRSVLSDLVALSVPRIGGLFILRTDASGSAIAGCLYQRCDDNIDSVQVTGDGAMPIDFF